MQLIDRDKLRSALENAIRSRDINRVYDRYFREGLIAAMLHLGNQPTIEERKHGHWIGKPIAGYGTVRCSVCKSKFTKNTGQWDYCPKCGAQMDEVMKK